MTKDQLITFLARRKAKKLVLETTWSDLVTALGDLTADEKDKIAKAIATGGGLTIVNRLQGVIKDKAIETATAAATAALTDDNLTLLELDDLL